MAIVIRPKETTGVLQPKIHTFVHQNGEVYDYYSVKLGEQIGSYVQIVRLPPVIKEGFITYKGNLYALSFRDYFRRRLNVGQQPYRPANATNPSTGTSADGPSGTGSTDSSVTLAAASISGDESGSISAIDLQINQDANVAWKEQIGALLHTLDPEEEWDLTNVT